VLYILNEKQKQVFLDLAEQQAPQLEELAKMRLPLIKAFYMQRDNQIPAGSNGLNKEAVIQHVGNIFVFDAELSLRRAEAMAQVALSLTPEQKAYLSKMKFGDFNTWPAMDERDAIRNQGRGKSQLFNVAYMTYASEFFSWTAGSVEADTYFCPERHGTYFGGFYMKDMPAMGKRDYDISTSITGDNGRAFLDSVLTEQQRVLITGIPDKQRELLKETITVRRSISQELRKLLDGKTPDKAKILSMGRRYGELDGEMSWYYATAFAKVNQTLTKEQLTSLMKLRNLEGYISSPYYIYLSPAQNQPVLNNVESFFFIPKGMEQ
jgi:Spy/CpxP family protein refolding chaperone